MKKKINKPVKNGVAKVPMVMQLETLECGAACLAMVLAYYSKWIPLEQMRIDCGVSRDGSSGANIMKAARRHTLDTAAYRFEPEALKKEGQFPCIIHWNFNHFVVLCGFRGSKAVINDPARGTVTVSAEEFDRAFTGICIMFEPLPEFEPSGKPKSVYGFIKKRLKGTGGAFLFVVLISLVSALVGVVSPGFSRVFMDRLLTYQNPDWFAPFMVGLALFSLLQIAVSAVDTLQRNKISGKLAALGSSSFLWKVLHLPAEYFSQRLAGDIQTRQQSNAGIADNLINRFAPLALDGIMLVFYLYVMVNYSITLSAVGIISVVLNALLGRFISKQRVNILRVQMRDWGKLEASSVSGIEMIETIKAAGAENGYFHQWAGFQADVNNQRVRVSRLNSYLGIIPAFVSALCDAAVLFLGVWLVITQTNFTVGMVMQFQMLLGSFVRPANSFLDVDKELQEMKTSMERIEDVMEYPSDSYCGAKGDKDSPGSLSGRLTMKNVTFGYSPLGAPVLKDFNLKLAPGKSVAIVGATGCGKSTATKLIAGLYKPQSGEILFDGKRIDQIDRDVFTSCLSVVDQDITLFEDTIENNIKMWDSTIDDADMIKAAKDAGIHDEIVSREGAYSNRITENGNDLSGGQRQRIEIARALAKNPKILIMDEATSALDAKTEYEVVKAVKKRGITLIVVAHRLSTIRDCDEIIVLDRGEIAERGTHKKLLAKGGLYANLVVSD